MAHRRLWDGPGVAVAVGAGMSSAGEAAGAGRAGERAGELAAPRVFISYAHDDAAHEERVRDFWLFLRNNGIDASLDLPAAGQRQDWAEWMTRQVRDADRVLVVASPDYKRRAEGDAGPGEGRGVQWEARLIRDRLLPTSTPGCSWCCRWCCPAARPRISRCGWPRRQRHGMR